MAEDSSVTTARFWSMDEAHFAQGLLREAGITSSLRNEHFIQERWSGVSSIVNGVELQVPVDDAGRAAETLLRDPRMQQGVWDANSTAVKQCRRCQSTDLRLRQPPRRYKMAAWALAGAPYPGTAVVECDACGLQWRVRVRTE